MRRLKVLAAASLILVCPLAAHAQSPSEMILGQWTCSASTPDGLVSSQMTYRADGTTSSILILTSGSGATITEAVLKMKSTWRIPGDGTLREQVLDVDVIRFTVGDKPVGASDLDGLIEGLKEEEAMSSSLKITGDSISMIDRDGTRTACMR